MNIPNLKIEPCDGIPFNILVEPKQGKYAGFFKVLELPGKRAQIYYMYIKNKQRKKGYGAEVMRYLKHIFETIDTQINASTDESIKWLTKHDFKQEGPNLVWRKNQ